MSIAADTIIIGGGTAGCVLAARLSEDPAHRVLLLEAGPEAWNPWVKIPAGVSKLIAHPQLNWRRQSAPDAAGHSAYLPAGRMLGGSSSLNGMTWIRGQRADYDGWGVPGWGSAEVWPAFDALEAAPFGIGAITHRHPLPELVRQAAIALGIPDNPDFNGATQEGVGWYSVAMRRGRRVSSETAYLAPARARPNLQVLTEALAARLVFDGTAVRGVAYWRGEVEQVATAPRVIVCAGSFASPQLLQVSGIGDAGHLRSLGVPVVVDAPQVGQGLQEQARVDMRLRCRHPTFNQEARGWHLAGHVLCYALARRGLLTTTGSQVALFLRSAPGVEHPDTQINIRPASGDFQGDKGFVLDRYPGVTAFACNLRPASRGHVRAVSADMRQMPQIALNLLADPADLAPIRHGVAVLRQLVATAPLRDEVVEEVLPGPQPDLDAYIRDHAQPLHHAAGTCRMGTDAGSVLDADLRVRGVQGVFVADASVMPRVTSGNTMAPVLMIAEQLAKRLAA